MVGHHQAQLFLFLVFGCCAWGKANIVDYANCTGLLSSIGNGDCDSSNNNEGCGWDGGDCCECTCEPNPDNPHTCYDFDCLDPNSGCTPGCSGYVSFIGNGWCNAENNNEACDWDGGDCCECTCPPDSHDSCRTLDFVCLDPDSGCTDSTDHVLCGGNLTSFGDGACDSENNNADCGWDGGDCCECTCLDGESYECQDSEFFCLDPNSGCVELAIVDQTKCVGNVSLSGNGLCDSENNNEACGWDGGDCCECTCNSPYCVSSFSGGYFDCRDPKATREQYGCMEWSSVSLSCLPRHQYMWVETTSHARALVEALNCSGGVFEVKWSGNVIVNQTFFVHEGTLLNVTGVGSSALMDGGSVTGLFKVANASLHLSNIALVNGSSTSGGAFAALGSNVTLNHVTFVGNVAEKYGGAVFVGGGSTVAGSGQINFSNNSAVHGGGAVWAIGRSLMTWTSGTIFSRNNAALGGAISISEGSSVLWANNRGANVSSNATSYSLDGIYLFDSGSTGTWKWGAIFEGNYAISGGGLAASAQSTVRWEGDSIFRGNKAAFCGGALVMLNSEASWEGLSIFEGNTADTVAGGLCLISVNVSWSKKSYFFYNFAKDMGGALAAASYSNISWGDEATFFSNRAADGGAVLLVDVTNASWLAATNFTNNTASGEDGGGIALSDGSTASWMGETTFADNHAFQDGGALKVSHFSSVVGRGKTHFSGNTAAGDGGSLFLEGNVSWEGETTFFDNAAVSLGGAVYVAGGGHISWHGGTLFVNNTAYSGGAIAIASCSHVSWTAETNFTSNQARHDGGAVSFTPPSSNTSCSLSSKESSTITIDGATYFTYNKCGWSGGAMALSGLLSLSANAAMTFLENSANVYGGAVYIASVGIGPMFYGSRFDSNDAQVGGAVYTVASGTTVTTNPTTDGRLEHPTTFYNCSFVNNTAFSTGGGVSTASGQDMFVSTSFISNVARVGGALQLAGTTSVTSCLFEGNIADSRGGPAVSNIGYISEANSTSFLRNFISCESGSFLNFSEGRIEDLWEVVCDGCHATYENCIFEEPVLVPKCISISDAGIEHASSSGGVTTIEQLKIDQGYWRATPNSAHILECYNSDACKGGVTGREDYCIEGYNGAYCSVCDASYTSSLNFVCTPCIARKWGIMIAGIACGIGLIVGIAVVFHLLSTNVSGSGGNFVDHAARFVPLQSIKIIIVAWQIVTQFTSVANVTFPEIYQRFLDAVDILNFDLSFVLSAGCVLTFDFHDKLLIVTIAPIVGLALLAITYTVGAARHRCSEDALRTIRHKHMSMVLLITFLVYSSVSSMVFQTFACEVLDDGINYLRADYRIDCDSAKHEAMQIYSGIMIMLYPVGIPLLYATLLFKGRSVLRNALGRDVSSELMSVSDLWKPYKPSRFYYEIIECVRRISLTGAVVFIYPNTAAQIAMTLVMTFCFTVVSEGLAPYDSGWDCWINRTGHIIVFLSMYVALLLKVEVSSERASSQTLLASILVAAQACMVLTAVVEAAIMACSVRILKIDEPRPRFAARLPFRRVNDRTKIGVSTFDGIEASTNDADLESKSHD